MFGKGKVFAGLAILAVLVLISFVMLGRTEERTFTYQDLVPATINKLEQRNMGTGELYVVHDPEVIRAFEDVFDGVLFVETPPPPPSTGVGSTLLYAGDELVTSIAFLPDNIIGVGETTYRLKPYPLAKLEEYRKKFAERYQLK